LKHFTWQLVYRNTYTIELCVKYGIFGVKQLAHARRTADYSLKSNYIMWLACHGLARPLGNREATLGSAYNQQVGAEDSWTADKGHLVNSCACQESVVKLSCNSCIQLHQLVTKI
jgi:hypothetical protein